MDAVYERVHEKIKVALVACEDEQLRYAAGYPSTPSEHEWSLRQAIKYEVVALLLAAVIKAGELLFGKEKKNENVPDVRVRQ